MTITQKLPKPSKADERDAYELVTLRDDGVCVRCHRTDHGIVSRDHRKNRSQGGLTTVANLQILCRTGTTGCHGYLTEHPLAALADGWSVPSYAVPSEWPARRYLRSQYGTLRPVWVLYDNTGGFVEISDERAHGLMEGVAQMGTEVRASVYIYPPADRIRRCRMSAEDQAREAAWQEYRKQNTIPGGERPSREEFMGGYYAGRRARAAGVGVAVSTPTDPREVAHIECDCVPDLGPSHCHLCGERAGHPVPWTEAHPVATDADDLQLLASLVNVDGDSEVHYIAAGRILAAGFHRTPVPAPARTVSTVDEMDALPVGAIVRSDDGGIAEKYEAPGPNYFPFWVAHKYRTSQENLWPATVLYVPDAVIA